MGRKAGIQLTAAMERALRLIAKKTKDKREYRAATGILLRGKNISAYDVARQLGVSIKQVFVWTRKFRAEGTAGLRMKKQTGRIPKKKNAAKESIVKLIDQDPQLFGFLKGRWVLRDIARHLKNEGIEIHYTGVHRILKELDITLKSPKLRAPGSIKKNYRKRAEIRRYRRIAPALLKKKFS